MTIAGSGPVSIGGGIGGQSITAEFGRAPTVATSLHDLYAAGGILGTRYAYPGGGIVDDGFPSVPTGGPISLSEFYGGRNIFVFNPTITSNQQNFNWKQAAINAGWDQVKPLISTLTIGGGVIMYASDTGQYAFSTGITFPAGSVLYLVNYGWIVGRGGNGGNANAALPTNGGPAFIAQVGISVWNYGGIGGGGGGGGAGGNTKVYVLSNELYYTGGGGGGGGAGFGAGGAFCYSPIGPLTNGDPGAATSGGAGGQGSYGGAPGGGLGGGGGNGQTWDGFYDYPGQAGAAPGQAIWGYGNIAWGNYGTVLGAVG